MPLDLLVPDLLAGPGAPEAMRALRLPALERWLARAGFEDAPAHDAMAWLAAAHGIAGPVPAAALALLGEGREAPGAWLRADPVHVRAAQDRLTLHAAGALGMAAPEAEALAATLAAHFAPDGIALHAVARERWYARVPAADVPETTPLDAALGRDLFGLLPRGGGRINWRSALTEAQMLLSTHPVNAEREARGLPAVNSVWFWGGGELPARVEHRYAEVHADDVFARGLGRASGASVHALPSGIGAVDLVAAGSRALVVLDALAAPMRAGDLDAWRAAAARLDADWFAALGEAAARFDTVRVVLPAAGRTRIATLTPAARWRWLRRARPLASHA